MAVLSRSRDRGEGGQSNAIPSPPAKTCFEALASAHPERRNIFEVSHLSSVGCLVLCNPFPCYDPLLRLQPERAPWVDNEDGASVSRDIARQSRDSGGGADRAKRALTEKLRANFNINGGGRPTEALKRSPVQRCKGRARNGEGDIEERKDSSIYCMALVYGICMCASHDSR